MTPSAKALEHVHSDHLPASIFVVTVSPGSGLHASMKATLYPIVDELNSVYEVLCAGRVLTAWKVWRTWSNGGGETGLRFDDSNVQTKLAAGLVDREKVSLLTSLFVASLVKQAKVLL